MKVLITLPDPSFCAFILLVKNATLKYEGFAYLLLKDYDKAVKSFHALSLKLDLFSNPGLFYEALALVKRNSAGDADAARKLLKQVVDKKLEGETEAEKILKKL